MTKKLKINATGTARAAERSAGYILRILTNLYAIKDIARLEE